jgi:hypothetical protein
MLRGFANRRKKKDPTPSVRNRMDVTDGWDATWNASFLLALFDGIELLSHSLWFSRFKAGASILHKSHEALR